MARIRSRTFTTIRTEGGLLPADLLVRVASLDKGIPGLSNSDYHLMNGESFGNKIAESWSRLSTAWRHFATLRAALPEGDPGTTVTREKWLLPLFSELGYGRLSVSRAVEVEGRSFPISHMWGSIPIHLVGVNIPLDRRSAGVKGASVSSPHSLIQEFLNKSPDHLWALISNGLDLRILRDNASLTRQAFVEFDLEAMFSDQVYDDFVVLWMVCHQSRVEADVVSQAWLEKWTTVASQDGTRALDNLRISVELAISQLGTGFVEHPQNVQLRESLRNGTLSSQDLYREILRLIYRLIFLFVAEDRNLLHSIDAGHVERNRYLKFYSLTRMRTLAGRRRGGPHPDLWRSMIQVFAGLGTEKGIPSLGLNGLGSFLWSQSACPSLDNSNIANHRLLAAVRHLSFVEDGIEKVLRPIDYRNLGSEELGAIYESLLEQHPVVNTDAGTFELNTAAGNERKTTGSYYTPTSLITELLDSAVNPVLDEAVKKQNPEQAILELNVIDPACGSGHFLIAAAHRIAKRLAAVRTGDEEPSPDSMRSALREVIAQCIHGIDLNPMAVELCKVSLWMESMEPGKALGFLDNRIIRGNGLIGATPELLAAGVPDDAFKALTGDDKAVVSSLKKRNKIAQSGQAVLFGESDQFDLKAVAELFVDINLMADTTVESVQVKATRWSELVQSAEYQNAVHAADTWCAAFVAPKVAGQPVITQQEFLTARDNPQDVNPEVRTVVNKMAEQYAFLHPYLAFADVFGRGGFDLVLGNPPWLSFSGRQQAPIQEGLLELLKFLYPQTRSWPASHSCFLLQSARITRVGGHVGLVLPFQVSELSSYAQVRDEISKKAIRISFHDAGEDAFEGVSQRSGLLSFEINLFTADIGEDSRGNWGDSGTKLIGTTPELIELLTQKPCFPEGVFFDPGVHSGNVSKRLILKFNELSDDSIAPIREGRDIDFYKCGKPVKGLKRDLVLAEGEYFRVGQISRYLSVKILVRQTANRPIACLHENPTYFRNSILACMGVPGIPIEVVLAILNSTLIGEWYRSSVNDSSQKTFPQVKISSLRKLPFFCDDVEEISRTQKIEINTIENLVHRVQGFDALGNEIALKTLEEIDLAVFRLYEIPTSISEKLMDDVRRLS